MSAAETANRYGDRHPTWHAEDSGHKAHAIWHFAQQCKLAPHRVVDVGCGAGGVTARIRHMWPHVEGWDPALEAIKRARQNHPDATFHHGQFETTGQRADLIVCLDVIEHVEDDVAFVAQLGAAADDLLLRVPLDWSLLDAARPRRLEAHLKHLGHVQLYSRRVLERRLRMAGLTVEALRYDRVPPGMPRTWAGHLTGAIRNVGEVVPTRPIAWLLGGWSVLIHARRSAPVGEMR